MISKTPRLPGRPPSSTRIRADDCSVIRATRCVTRPGRLRSGPSESRVLELTVTWPEGRHMAFRVALVATTQRLGGFRLWFACPSCGRRVGCLFSGFEEKPLACRHCLRLVYRSQYLTPEVRSFVRWFKRMERRHGAVAERRRAALWNEPDSTAGPRRPAG